MSPNTLYNNKGVLYADEKSKESTFRKYLTAELDKIINEEHSGQEYARTFLPVQDLYEYNYESNRFKNLINDINSYLDMNVRGTLLTSPLYGSDNSYSSYINQNPRNELYQQVINNKLKQEVHTVKDLNEKYFLEPTYTSLKPHII